MEDGLNVGTLEEVGIDLTSLGKAVDRIRDGKYGEVHSMLIFKDGKLVFEEYFPGHQYKWDGPNYHGIWINWNDNRKHNIMSAGKSITSAAVGIAIDEGFIGTVDQSIFDYLPEHQHFKNSEKEAITIEHLLTMTSGLEWKEWGASYSSNSNDLVRIWDDDDQVARVLEMPLINEPGTDFTYTGGGMTVLGEIVKNATGMDIESFANEYLFAPMGIDPVEWKRFDSGVIYAGGEQYMTPREMLKFGVTYLNDGLWNRERIINEDWVELSSVPFGDNTRISVPGSDGGRKDYGYSWWIWPTRHNGEELEAIYAGGWGGQRIIVIPDLETVVVFTGGNYTGNTKTFAITEDFILAALE
jgi:CubicO group peptidase (beta-lactamase class C family)